MQRTITLSIHSLNIRIIGEKVSQKKILSLTDGQIDAWSEWASSQIDISLGIQKYLSTMILLLLYGQR